MNTDHNQLLLLPPGRNLLIKQADGQPVIEEIPEWLANYIGQTSHSLLGKPVDPTLESVIPGIVELVNRTNSDMLSYKGISAHITDKNGQQHHLMLDSVNEKSCSQNLVRILIQEISATFPAHLENSTFCGLVGASDGMKRVFNKIKMYAASDAAVLVTGETGAGKEGVAAAIHQMSSRRNGPFVTMNCSAITDTLFESELFGHEKGSFTGAVKSHRGRFERADGGTLFLDELGDLPAISQAKLLRALETCQIERVGSEKTIKVDVRIVAATNHDLEKLSRSKDFRSDLFYRINALQIVIPPLRQRHEDIELLIQHFIRILNKKYERTVSCLTREAIQLLKQYQWPGNVRELRNLLERLFAENQTDVIGLRALKEWYEERMNAAQNIPEHGYREVTVLPHRQAIPLGMGPQPTKSGNEKPDEDDLRRAYQMAGGNITRASEILGIHKATFYRALKSLNLSREDL